MDNWQLTPAHNIGKPLGEQLKSARREGGLITAVLHLAWFCVARVYLKVFHRLSIQGRKNLPDKGPFVLVSNHASHLDTLVLASVISWRLQSRVFPVAAGDTFFSTRIAGTLSAVLINALPMWRHRACGHGVADLRSRLSGEGCIYIVFPEGTRTRDGRMSRFRPGVGMLVAQSQSPVVPCFIDGSYLALPYSSRFPKPRKLRLRVGKPILFTDVPDDRGGWESIAKSAESAVRAIEMEGHTVRPARG